MNNSIKVFVPGSLCLIGNHSEWINYDKAINQEMVTPMSIVTPVSEGILAEASINEKIILQGRNYKTIICDYINLKETMEENPFWKYVLCTISYLKIKYQELGGIHLKIKKDTLTMKKGLVSSSAICLLVVKAYNLLYNLNLSKDEETDIAYHSELLVESKPNPLIQNDHLGPTMIQIANNHLEKKLLLVAQNVYMVYAIPVDSKTTTKSLCDFVDLAAFYGTENDEFELLDRENIDFMVKTCSYLANGNIEKLGVLMTEYQRKIDSSLIKTGQELKVSIIQKLLNDENIKNLIYGGKCCYFNSNEAIEFIVRDKECQTKLVNYLKNLNIYCRKTTIKSNKIKKAIIPVGGYGTRMYPMTKCMGKEFLPVKCLDETIKPAILILLEEVIEAGIEKICLVLPKKYQKRYIEFFLNQYEAIGFEEHTRKLQNIFNKLTFINDDEQKGLANSINLCKKFIGNDCFMLLLGDQIYKSNSKDSCVKQILNFYYKKYLPVISVGITKIDGINNYGILYGDSWIDDNSFYIKTIVEKPSIEFARRNLKMIKNNEEVYYSVFGCYILDSYILSQKNIDFSINLANYIFNRKCIAFIPSGRYFDIGNVQSYYDTFINFSKGDKYEENY